MGCYEISIDKDWVIQNLTPHYYI